MDKGFRILVDFPRQVMSMKESQNLGSYLKETIENNKRDKNVVKGSENLLCLTPLLEGHFRKLSLLQKLRGY